MYNKKTKICVFDIETIPDGSVCQNLIDFKGTEEEEIEKLIQYHTEKYTNDFPRQLFHKVVCVSYLVADLVVDSNGNNILNLNGVKTGCEIGASEKDIVKSFFEGIKALNCHVNLVSFNGRTFDLPVLKYRAMKHGVHGDWLMDTKDKWNNYSSRYSADYHCDLLDVLSDYGSSAKIKMSEVCALLGIPVKLDGAGDSVLENYKQGKIQEIRDYCETDVIATYLVYLKYLRFCGKAQDGVFEKNIQQAEDYLIKHKDKKHFKAYLDKWDLMRKI